MEHDPHESPLWDRWAAQGLSPAEIRDAYDAERMRHEVALEFGVNADEVDLCIAIDECGLDLDDEGAAIVTAYRRLS